MNAAYWKRVLISAQEAGLSTNELAAREEVHPCTVRQWSMRLGVKLTKKNVAVDDWEGVLAEAAREGLSASDLARRLGCSPHTVATRARIHGVELRDGRRGPLKRQDGTRQKPKPAIAFELERMERVGKEWRR